MAVYAISDLHSCMKLWTKVKEYISPEDTLYVLGDSCDRGPDGINVLLELLERPNTIMIRGNHDQFMIDFLKNNMAEEYNPDNSYLWFTNGGGGTYDALISRDDDFLRSLLIQLDKMPTRVDYTNIKGQTVILTHAGFNPFGNIYNIAKEMNDWKKLNDIYLWDRGLVDKWTNEYKGVDYSNVYLVHGHTPTIIYGKMGMWEYADGHKFNIDMGAFYTHKTCLFNLDTLKVESYFYEDGYDMEEEEMAK